MTSLLGKIETRRRFLRYLAMSPALAFPALARQVGFAGSAGEKVGDLITSPDQALDIMDFEAVAHKTLPPAHWGYLATGVDDDATVKANHDGYQRLEIRSRRLIDVSKLDTSVQIFGTKWETPIFLSPVSAMKAFHDDGEVAAARAAGKKHHLQILSTVASCSIEETSEACGRPLWQQLYPTNDWNVTKSIIKRAEAAGSPVLVFTVDLQENSNRETIVRGRRADDRECSACHESGFAGYAKRLPMLSNLDLSKVTALHAPNLTWDFVKRLKDATTMKLMIKGIVTHEDAQIAVEHGVDGLVVSNHGGRAEETLRPTIESLPDVVAGVKGKIPVLVDGGVRRGTDVFKAMALGATAVGIGRPYAWGMASFGQQGVEGVLTILRREFEQIMREASTPSIRDITSAFVVRHA
jgi:isopentenyl diphosphate isomerase/L-lactate dehydrogenase-like FMN-dependent dehydrogenase